MSDQRNTLAAMIVAAIDRVNTSIQKTATYISANSFTLIGNGLAESAGVSALLGFLGVVTLVPGISTVSGGASGSLEVETELIGALAAQSGEAGDLDILTGLGSSIVEISGIGAALGILEVSSDFSGLISAISGASAVRLNTILMAGESDGVGVGSAELDVLVELAGISAGTTSGASSYMWK